MKTRFLSVGECMVELLDEGGGDYRQGFAGDTFNTAWYARRLLPPDWRVGFASAVGEDPLSDRMVRFMAAEGVETGAVRRLAGRTVGLYMVALDAGERRFAYWRGESAARRLAEDRDWLARVLAGCGVIYFSGITLAILPPGARSTLCKAIGTARADGALVAFDTNLRPALWPDAAAMREGAEMGAAVADLVLPSFDEEQAAFGDAMPEDTLDRYRALGARIVAVKNGADPLLLWDGAVLRKIGAERAGRVVDTTAAGDSFAAGMLAAMVQGATPEAAAQAGMALAARVIQGRGALVRAAIEGGRT